MEACNRQPSPEATRIGEYRGFRMELAFDFIAREYRLSLKHRLSHTIALGADVLGNLIRIDNALNGMPERMAVQQEQLENLNVQIESAKVQVAVPFPQEAELQEKSQRLDELNSLLNMDQRETEVIDEEPEEELEHDNSPSKPARKMPGLER